MRLDDGQWLAPPPLWPAIKPTDNTLSQWIDMDDPTFGDSLDFATMIERYGHP